VSPEELDVPLDHAKPATTAGEAHEADTQSTPPAVERKNPTKYIFLAVAALIAIVLVTVLVQRPSDPEEYLKSAGYGGVLLMGIIGSSSPLWPLPGSWAAFIAAGLGMNPILLGLAAGLGEPIGELSGYTVGYGGHRAVQKWNRYPQVERLVRRYGGPSIFLVSAIPNFGTKLATTAAGTLRYPVGKFFLYCWAGKTLKSLAFAFAGAGFFEGVKNLFERVF
jgi:membrane protein YqaA with SNARE-associated domain